MRVLVVEDEPKVATALRMGLEAEHCAVRIASTGEEGFYVANTEPFDLILLDVMLPGRDGFEILTAMRRRGIRTPTLLLTARDSVEDRVRGLDSGADDYLVKPFAFSELMARMRALLRRGRPDAPHLVLVADLELDNATRTVTRGGKSIDLTPREFDILALLARNRGSVVSRETMARDLWNEAARHTPLDNVIDVHIARLRRKIDEPFERKLLQTVRGVGFMLRE